MFWSEGVKSSWLSSWVVSHKPAPLGCKPDICLGKNWPAFILGRVVAARDSLSVECVYHGDWIIKVCDQRAELEQGFVLTIYNKYGQLAIISLVVYLYSMNNIYSCDNQAKIWISRYHTGQYKSTNLNGPCMYVDNFTVGCNTWKHLLDNKISQHCYLVIRVECMRPRHTTAKCRINLMCDFIESFTLICNSILMMS